MNDGVIVARYQRTRFLEMWIINEYDRFWISATSVIFIIIMMILIILISTSVLFGKVNYVKKKKHEYLAYIFTQTNCLLHSLSFLFFSPSLFYSFYFVFLIWIKLSFLNVYGNSYPMVLSFCPESAEPFPFAWESERLPSCAASRSWLLLPWQPGFRVGGNGQRKRDGEREGKGQTDREMDRQRQASKQTQRETDKQTEK